MKPPYIQPRAGWFASSVFLFPSGSRIKNVKPHLVWVQPCEKENAGFKEGAMVLPSPRGSLGASLYIDIVDLIRSQGPTALCRKAHHGEEFSGIIL